jgi:hypothetical protein
MAKGRIEIGRYWLTYRGFQFWMWSHYFTFKPIHIGTTRLYTLGPLGLFVNQKEKN